MSPPRGSVGFLSGRRSSGRRSQLRAPRSRQGMRQGSQKRAPLGPMGGPGPAGPPVPVSSRPHTLATGRPGCGAKSARRAPHIVRHWRQWAATTLYISRTAVFAAQTRRVPPGQHLTTGNHSAPQTAESSHAEHTWGLKGGWPRLKHITRLLNE